MVHDRVEVIWGPVVDDICTRHTVRKVSWQEPTIIAPENPVNN